MKWTDLGASGMVNVGGRDIKSLGMLNLALV